MIWSVLAVLFIMDFFEHKRRGKRIKELEHRMDNLTIMIKKSSPTPPTVRKGSDTPKWW